MSWEMNMIQGQILHLRCVERTRKRINLSSIVWVANRHSGYHGWWTFGTCQNFFQINRNHVKDEGRWRSIEVSEISICSTNWYQSCAMSPGICCLLPLQGNVEYTFWVCSQLDMNTDSVKAGGLWYRVLQDHFPRSSAITAWWDIQNMIQVSKSTSGCSSTYSCGFSIFFSHIKVLGPSMVQHGPAPVPSASSRQLLPHLLELCHLGLVKHWNTRNRTNRIPRYSLLVQFSGPCLSMAKFSRT